MTNRANPPVALSLHFTCPFSPSLAASKFKPTSPVRKKPKSPASRAEKTAKMRSRNSGNDGGANAKTLTKNRTSKEPKAQVPSETLWALVGNHLGIGLR